MRILRSLSLVAALALLGGCQRALTAFELLEASASCDLPGAKAALRSGANVNTRSDSDATPLMVATGNGCVDVARALIAAGANVNATTRRYTNGSTALMDASSGHPAVIGVLIAAGANVNAKRADGTTALGEAASYGQPDAAKALLAAGADVNALDTLGQTPLDRALVQVKSTETAIWGTAKAHVDVVNVLRQHGGYAANPMGLSPPAGDHPTQP
jgi:hypothetical protein